MFIMKYLKYKKAYVTMSIRLPTAQLQKKNNRYIQVPCPLTPCLLVLVLFLSLF